MSGSTLQFLVVYQLADQISVNVTFFLDGSSYSNDQVRSMVDMHC